MYQRTAEPEDYKYEKYEIEIFTSSGTEQLPLTTLQFPPGLSMDTQQVKKQQQRWLLFLICKRPTVMIQGLMIGSELEPMIVWVEELRGGDLLLRPTLRTY